MRESTMLESRSRGIGGFFRRVINVPEIGASVAVVVFFLFFVSLDSSMADPGNFVRIATQASYMGFAAYGMSVLMLAGEIDLSAGAMAGLGAAVAGAIISLGGRPEWQGILGALIVAVLVGLLNSVIALKVGMPSFFATLGSSFIVTGITLVVLQGRWLYVINQIPFLTKVGSASPFWEMPWTFVIFFGLVLVGDQFIRRTKVGAILSATGGNKRAAQVSGINIVLVKTLCFVLASILSAVAGILILGAGATADQKIGDGWQLWVIAIAIIGGSSFSGGVGSILGGFIGTILMMVIKTGLAAARIQTNAQGIVVGSILVGAAILDVARRKMKKY